MQAQTPEVSTAKATTPANIKRYTVSEQFGDDKVTLEVDHNLLTPELAYMINEFWSNADDRILEENGDVVRAVIRFFGQVMINTMLMQGGAEFSERSRSPMGDENPGPLWTADVHNEEGWGGTVDGNPFGRCGIRCIAASVSSLDFDDLQVDEVANA